MEPRPRESRSSQHVVRRRCLGRDARRLRDGRGRTSGQGRRGRLPHVSLVTAALRACHRLLDRDPRAALSHILYKHCGIALVNIVEYLSLARSNQPP